MSLTTSELFGLQASKYSNVAGLAILIYDYVITLEDEVRWIWGRSWDVTRVIFTISRYVPFVGAGMTVYVALCSNLQSCELYYIIGNIILPLGVIAAELLLVLRVYAFWQSDKRVLYGLLAYAVLATGAVFSIRFMPVQLIPQGGRPQGCSYFSARNVIFMYLFLFIFEIAVLWLMVYKRFRAYRDVRLPIVHKIYQDGTFYIVCIILFTFANTIVVGVYPLQYAELLDILQVAIHSVLASRILFNLRKSTQLQEAETCTPLSDIACRTGPTSQHATEIAPHDLPPRSLTS